VSEHAVTALAGCPRAARVRLEPVDLLILATIGVFAGLAVIFCRRVDGWLVMVAKDLAAAAVFLAAVVATRRIRQGWAWFLARTAAVSLACAWLFGAVARLQLIVHGRWLDGVVLGFEERLFGVQPTIWLERFIRPWLTEWMMFAYVVYIALYPLVCLVIYQRRGERALEECLLALGLANVACDLGFILFPVAGPAAFMGTTYTVPLDGWMFTAVGEFIRTKLHYVGGSLPSPHAAAATVMWAMCWRYSRRLAWALVPVILTLYVATFYCRYHYLTDAIAGIATAAAALALTPRLMRWWQGRYASECGDPGCLMR
jgi:membrane-associated phospholipid phosphatase